MIIGVCGKIASGKSEVLKVLGANGFYLIDADKIVFDLYKPGAVGTKKVETFFGREFIEADGSVNKRKLRDLVFRDSDKRKYLENLIHPEVYSELVNLIGRLPAKDIAIEAVYFDQNFLDDFVDQLIWVERPVKDIISVLITDRKFDIELAELASSLVKRNISADHIIRNRGSLSELKSMTLKILAFL